MATSWPRTPRGALKIATATVKKWRFLNKTTRSYQCLGSLLTILALLPSFPAAGEDTFTNPLLRSGADPSVAQRAGFYYYMQTTGHNLTIWKTRDVTDLRHAERKVVWTPPATGPDSHEIWAPELHFLNGKWYIYFTADAGSNESHRLYVLENSSPDPLAGDWIFKGPLAPKPNKWAIDPSVFANRGKLYLIWSGWEGDVNGMQNLYIAQLRNPTRIKSRRVRISMPEYPWERYTGSGPVVYVNEGPEILERDGKIFLIYSASGCWTDHYALGMLTASANSNLLDPKSWSKSPEAVFSESPEAHAYGTGHNTFFVSPDGKQNWLLYHANPEPDEGCRTDRSPRAQPFTWKADGRPDFGTPIPLGQPVEKPSGTQ